MTMLHSVLRSVTTLPTAAERLRVARATLLAPTAIDETLLARLLAQTTRGKADAADIFLESVMTETWRLDAGRVSGGSFEIGGGAGIRATDGDKTSFAYTADLSAAALDRTAEAASAISRAGAQVVTAIAPVTPYPSNDRIGLYGVENPVTTDATAKTDLLLRIDALAREADARIVNVTAHITSEYRVVMVMREDGRLASDVRPLINFRVGVIAEGAGRRESGSAGGGGRYTLAELDSRTIDEAVTIAVSMAIVNLAARPAPSGPMTIVLGNGFPGVLLHEAVGHGLEGDFNRNGSSAFAGRIGERVAAPGVTVVDDGTVAFGRGSLTIDDEGEPTQRTVLIEDGYLAGYIQDRLNARLMNMRPTGNGRRQSYAHLPMPRMTNTYLEAGSHTPEEIVRSVKSGIFAKAFGGGTVDITSGQFNFSTTEAYLIEDGRITAPIQGATLIGSGPTSLKTVSMVGNDLALDRGSAVCGKAGQSVPVGVGQPTIRIDEMIVGGAA